MKLSKHVPDGTRIMTTEGIAYVVFNPPWYRLDRLLVMLWLVFIAKRAHANLKFTAVVLEKDAHKLVEVQIPAYAEK